MISETNWGVIWTALNRWIRVGASIVTALISCLIETSREMWCKYVRRFMISFGGGGDGEGAK